jgi:DNA-binding XRE family transcriptional regulator
MEERPRRAPDGPGAGARGTPRDRPAEEAAWDADAVRRLRAHLALTQGELARRLGTRQQTVSEWETGARAPQRMSRRLLHLVAEDAGWYDAATEAEAQGPPAGSGPPP